MTNPIKAIKKLLLRDNILSLIGNGSNAVLNFLVFLIMSRTLEKEVFGVWILFITTATTLDLLRFGVTRPGMVYFLSANKEDKNAIIGSGYKIEIYIYFILTAILLAGYFIVKRLYPESLYLEVLLFYPIMGLFNLPWNMTLPYLNAEKKYGSIMKIRLLFSGTVLILISAYFYKMEVTVRGIILIFLIANFVASLYTMIKGLDGIRHLISATKEYTNKLFHYGKFSIGTFIGASLLSSADTFILSASVIMGPTSIAIYAIPLKFIEIIEIPLRSFSLTLMPLLSKYGLKQKEAFVYTLNRYLGASTFIFIIGGAMCLLLHRPFLSLFGGEQYMDVMNVQIMVLVIVVINGILLPFNRYTGVALDSINKPNVNFHKVAIMLGANIVGDLIAVFVFKSLPLVALSTFVFSVIGIWYAWYQLNRHIPLSFRGSMVEGVKFFKEEFNKLRTS